MNFLLTPEAERELAEAAAFDAVQVSPAVAGRFLATFESKMAPLLEHPGLGTPTSRGRRLFPLGRFPYLLLDRSEPEGLRIIAVAHQSRRPSSWRARG